MTHTALFRLWHWLPNHWVVRTGRPAMCLVLLVAMRIGAQSLPGQHPTSSLSVGPRVTDAMDDTENTHSVEEEKTLRALNAARQRSLVADTVRLVRLVNELNDEIARTNPDSLTSAQLRKVIEIEKLAHNVKDKMSTSVRGVPVFPQPHFPGR